MGLKLPRGKERIGDAGRTSESRLAKNLGGRATPASGAVAGAKGDIRLTDYLLEAKSTTSLSMTLKHEWLAKIKGEARDQGKRPGLTISFVKGDGRPIPSGHWVCIPLEDWEELIGERE